MKQKLTLLMVATLLLGVVFSINSVAWSFEKPTPIRIPEDQIIPQPFEGFEKSGAFCEIFNDFDSPIYYYGGFDSGMGLAVFMNPAQCGPSPYPFEITDVHFYLYEPDGDYHWPVAIRVNIRDSNQGDSCSGPGDVLCSEDFSVDSDTAHPYMMTLNLSNPCCVNQPFFLEIIYTEPRDPAHPHPSLMMDTHEYPADTCDNWGLGFMGAGIYTEWYDIWSPPTPGDAVIRATGYTSSSHCDPEWYWKEDKPDQEFPAPSGMPDFDQNQAQWIAYCGPTAVANCLWWFNAVPEGMSPPELIDTLARYFHTDPINGTFVDSMQLGLDQYFSDYDFDLQESTFWMPDFHEMEESLKVCQDIILLLGFWWHDGEPSQFIRGDVDENGIVDPEDSYLCEMGGPFSCDDAADVNDDGMLDMADCIYLTDFLMQAGPPPPPPFPDCGTDPTPDALDCAYHPCPGGWYREGGHFVTMAGVCSESLKIAFSDPDNDGAVKGGPGRVRPPEHPPYQQYPPTLHNDPTFVSQDVYDCTINPEFPSPGSEKWNIDGYWTPRSKYSGINVPQRFETYSRPVPKDDVVVEWHTEVEAAIMICPKPSNAVEGEEQGGLTPKDFELYQNYPNPFNNETLIKFNLRKTAEVTLVVYNILGQKVRTLVKGRMDAGSQSVSWDAKDEKGNELSSGIYFYQLKAGEVTETKRLVLLK